MLPECARVECGVSSSDSNEILTASESQPAKKVQVIFSNRTRIEWVLVSLSGLVHSDGRLANEAVYFRLETVQSLS